MGWSRAHALKCQAATLALLTVLAACGPAEVDDADHRPDLVSIGGKADELPSWMRPMSQRFACGEAPRVGTFSGRDSAHLYLFKPTEGRLARLELVGTYPWHRGAAIAIYDGETGALIELLRNPWDSRATLVYEPQNTREVVVAVYSLTWEASGGYQLSARCPLLSR